MGVRLQQQRIEQLQAALEAKKEEIKLTQVQYNTMEIDLKTREEDIAKMRLALNSARTNKDYSAILTRINTDKVNKSKLEDQILALMTQIENEQALCKEIEQNIEDETQRYHQLLQDSEERKVVIQEKIDKLTSEKDIACKEVPAEPRSFFERLAERYDGEVLAEVEKMKGANRGEHLCGGCYMKIPLESVNALMTKDDVVVCPNCGRMLVLDMSDNQQPAN